MQIYDVGLSSQAIEVYKLLLQRGILSASEIARELGVQRTAIYRLATHLMSIGMITEVSAWPKRFRANSLSNSEDRYLNYQRTWFSSTFQGIQDITKSKKVDLSFSLSFIEGREEIFQKIAEDLRKAEKWAKFIVLGLPQGISPELLFEQKNAVERDVPVKIIVQEYSFENNIVLLSWEKAGLDVRFGKKIGFHLLLIDNSITYLMTYEKENKLKRSAVRIMHAEINKQLQKIFDDYWRDAKKIKL
ncbi:hypothetical protein HYW54_03640 [Candidatus Gottesmanbacteria bacterium]|nr:hypothetical protein [Candidatus Gottesmanbacteria bacterium]